MKRYIYPPTDRMLTIIKDKFLSKSKDKKYGKLTLSLQKIINMSLYKVFLCHALTSPSAQYGWQYLSDSRLS